MPRSIVIVLTAAVLFAQALPVAAGQNDNVIRLTGEDTVAQVIAISQEAFPDGANRVVVGRADVFADSLAAGPLLGAEGGAPLLLTPTEELDDRTAEELTRLAPDEVVILGGPAAVSDAVAAEIGSRTGATVTRVQGPTRVETAQAVADLLPGASSVLLARATGDDVDATRAFADALAAGALGARFGLPVLLTPTSGTTPSLRSHLAGYEPDSVRVIGGRAAVADQVRTELVGVVPDAVRRGGTDRADTAWRLVDTFALLASGEGDGSVSLDGVILADGSRPDAWASGFAAAALAAQANLPIMLTSGAAVPGPTVQFVSALPPDARVVCLPTVADAACDTTADLRSGTSGDLGVALDAIVTPVGPPGAEPWIHQIAIECEGTRPFTTAGVVHPDVGSFGGGTSGFAGRPCQIDLDVPPEVQVGESQVFNDQVPVATAQGASFVVDLVALPTFTGVETRAQADVQPQRRPVATGPTRQLLGAEGLSLNCEMAGELDTVAGATALLDGDRCTLTDPSGTAELQVLNYPDPSTSGVGSVTFEVTGTDDLDIRVLR